MEKKSILVVDDAPENIALLVGLLKNNYQVKAARNGEVALRIACSPSPPDLILLDIVMPEMDGFEVCEHLKRNTTTSHIPVVFLSGHASSEETERGLKVGGEAYLQKPVEPEKLFSTIEEILSD